MVTLLSAVLRVSYVMFVSSGQHNSTNLLHTPQWVDEYGHVVGGIGGIARLLFSRDIKTRTNSVLARPGPVVYDAVPVVYPFG